MKDFLELLIGVIPEGRISAIYDAENILTELQVADHHTALTNTFSSELMEEATLATQIEDIYLDQLLEILIKMDIKISEDISLIEVVLILTTYLSIENRDHDSLYTLGELDDETSTLYFCHVLASLSGLDFTIFLPQVLEVSSDAVLKIKSFIPKEPAPQSIDDITLQIQRQIKSLVTTIGAEQVSSLQSYDTIVNQASLPVDESSVIGTINLDISVLDLTMNLLLIKTAAGMSIPDACVSTIHSLEQDYDKVVPSNVVNILSEIKGDNNVTQ